MELVPSHKRMIGLEIRQLQMTACATIEDSSGESMPVFLFALLRLQRLSLCRAARAVIDVQAEGELEPVEPAASAMALSGGSATQRVRQALGASDTGWASTQVVQDKLKTMS